MDRIPLEVLERHASATDRVEVAELIVGYLEDIGIEYVFGLPGGAIEPLYNALARSARRGGPRAIVARHESGAAYMADGYARETGKLGVCVATSGPGATNLLTGVACAYDNEIPLLVVTGQPPLPSFGRRAFQESACTGVNVVGMFQYCTRYNALVSHADQIETNLVNALLRARTAPQGPVHLSIPVDILRSPVTAPKYDLAPLLARTPNVMDRDSVLQLAELLKGARRTVFLIGGGCGHAIDAILELAQLTRALMLTTPDGKGFVNPEHPAYRGVFGFAGHSSAEALLTSEPDLILAFGISLGEWNSGAWSASLLNERLVHIDSCEEHFMRSPMARLQVRGPIPSVAAELLTLVRANLARGVCASEDNDVVPLFREVTVADPAKMSSTGVPIKPQRLMQELSRRCPPTTCFLADTGNSTAWAVHYLELRDRRALARAGAGARRASPSNGWLRVTMEFAPMGWAIGAAIGIASATRGRPVVCITGDGSYLMNGQEITVAQEEELPILFVVLNDGALGMVKHGQRLAGAEPVAFKLPQVDFRLQAESLGIPGFVVQSSDDIEALDLTAILQRRGPTLLDVRIDPEEVPPMKLRTKTLASAKP